MQVFRKLALGGLALVSASAFAEVPAGVTSAITTAGTDGATVAAAVIVAIVGIWAFKLIRKGLSGG